MLDAEEGSEALQKVGDVKGIPRLGKFHQHKQEDCYLRCKFHDCYKNVRPYFTLPVRVVYVIGYFHICLDIKHGRRIEVKSSASLDPQDFF